LNRILELQEDMQLSSETQNPEFSDTSWFVELACLADINLKPTIPNFSMHCEKENLTSDSDNNNSNDQVEEDEMGRACSTNVECM
jgi:hypothetical protein